MAEPVCGIARAWVEAGAPEEDLARVEEHAKTCATCARVVGADAGFEEKLAERVAELPKRVAPPASGWPKVAARIEARSAAIARRRRTTWGIGFALAAAAILVLALRPPRRAVDEAPIASAPPAPETAAPSASAPPPDVAFDEESAYASAADTLRAELVAKKPPAKVLVVVDDNVRIVDDAIRAVRSALAAHPDDPELRADLDRAYQDKVDLLRTATEIPEGVER